MPTRRLNPDLSSVGALKFAETLRSRIVGQERVVSKLINLYDVVHMRLSTPTKPLAVLLLCGPSGSGKTATCRATSEALLGHPDAMLRIDCAEFQMDHEVSKLVGSPPGYLGHRETQALLSQDALDSQSATGEKISIVLFDEIEKGAPALWRMLLGIFDRGKLRLGTGDYVTLTNTIIFMTSNIGTYATSKMLSGGMGFNTATPSIEDLDKQLYTTTKRAVDKTFPVEFNNRIDRMFVFRSLTDKQMADVLEMELQLVQRRLLNNEHAVVLQVGKAARALLLKEGTDPKYGARHLQRAIDRFLNVPLARLLATSQVPEASTLHVGAQRGKLTFDVAATALVGVAATGLE